MTENPSRGMRTLILGLDAACSPVLEPLFEAGAIPRLREVFEAGVSAGLESQIPPWTASAWPSMYTGVNPGKHGVYGFLSFDGYEYEVVNRTHVREYALWETLDRHGFSSVVVNVPVTHPPREIDGAIVPGYTAPEDPTCHPDGILEEIRDEIGEYRVYGRGLSEELTTDEQLAEYRALTRMRGEAFRHLVDRFDPDFGFLQFQQTDTVFHDREGDENAVRSVYEAVDEQVGTVLDECDPDTVFVVSDHGIGEYTEYEFRVNDYLRDHGFVETVRGGEGMPSWNSLARNRLANGDEGDDRDRSLLEWMTALAAKGGLTSQRAKRVFDAIGATDTVAEHVPTDVIRAGTEQVDFAASTAFMRSRIECGVRMNLAGRDPEGTIDPAEYESVRDELIDALENARTPDGDPVFESVVPREEHFSGPYADEAVDVVTVPADFNQYLSASIRGETFGPPSESWNHKLDGIVAAAGDGIDADVGIDDAHLFDVAPTVLATFDVPRSERMDGRVLPFVTPAGSEEYPEPTDVRTVVTDDEQVEDRLADLGYLE
jgi:predicted AlkP superfamily phosphohydrolase/phosphomutase